MPAPRLQATSSDGTGVDVVTSSSRPDLADEAAAAFREGWPEFVFHDAAAHEHLDRVGRYFAGYDVLVLDGGAVVAGGWGVPFRWDGTADGLPDGYDGALAAAVSGHEDGVEPNALSIMAAAVRADRRGVGLAGRVLTALRERAADAGLCHVVAPVRPTLKTRYPLIPMADFARWTRPDGLHLDPWIRTHQRLGATVLGPAPRSMVVTGTVSEWEAWAQMAFPQSGRYVVPGALEPVDIDRERDRGTYVETNLWMRHGG